jgi:hypothetical protein
MRALVKIMLAIASAAILLSLAAGTAGARTRIEISTTAILESARLTFQGENGVEMICDITLHSTLRRLINKIREEVVGLITAILTANIRGTGNPRACTFLTGMEIKYGAILGSLPNGITGILFLILLKFLIESEVLFVRSACLYEGLVSLLGALSRGVLSSLGFVEGRSGVALLRDLIGNGACPRSFAFRGAFTLRPPLTVRLLEA